MNGMAMRIILAICVLLPACAKEPEPVVVADLVRKDLFVVPLPDVPGAVPVDEHVESRIRIALDIDGMYVVKGRRVGPKELTQKLLVYADRKRDLDHPMQWSMVRALLAVHRDVTWGDLEGLLRIVADPDVRIRHAELLTWESEDGWKRRAVPLVLDSFQPGIARPVEPEVSLHVAPGASIDLYRRGLACVSAETIAKGIRGCWTQPGRARASSAE